MRKIKNYLKCAVALAIVIVCIVPLLRSATPQANQSSSNTPGTTTISQDRVQKVQEAGFDQEQRRQAKEGGVDNRSLLEIEDGEGLDTYTQTQAFFQVPELRELVLEKFKTSWKPVDYMDIIARTMVKEAQMRKKYWVFYNAGSSNWLLPRDVFKMLNNHFKPEKFAGEDFAYFWFKERSMPQAKDFLLQGLKDNGLIDDNGEHKGMLLSANLSLFGNTGFRNESTWRYFMTPIEHTPFNRVILEEMMDDFGVTHKYIDELIGLIELIKTDEQTLFQIFIPKDMIDDVGYLSWATGIPAHQETIDWVEINVQNKVYRKANKKKINENKNEVMLALEDLKSKFKKQQEKNPIFRDLLETVEKGDYSLDSVLKIYSNKPWELPNLNFMQARLLLSNEALLNPKAGIKMFLYTTVPRKKMSQYKKRLKDIMNKIISEKL